MRGEWKTKEPIPFPASLVLESGAFFIVRPTRQCKHTTQRGPPECTSQPEQLFIFKNNFCGCVRDCLARTLWRQCFWESEYPQAGASRCRGRGTNWSFRTPCARGNFCQSPELARDCWRMNPAAWKHGCTR